MNSTDPLENQLASWTPRKPSPGRKQRLFPGLRPQPGLTLAARGLAWMMPAFGTAVIVGSILVHPAAQSDPVLSGTNGPLFAALHSSAAQSAQNCLSISAFAWTNTTRGPSTNRSPGGLN